jgi:hypothetical protein
MLRHVLLILPASRLQHWVHSGPNGVLYSADTRQFVTAQSVMAGSCRAIPAATCDRLCIILLTVICRTPGCRIRYVHHRFPRKYAVVCQPDGADIKLQPVRCGSSTSTCSRKCI